ncbi:hypothetical protein JCM15457_2260 [Liquorilactobacillus sucicola DSM 21376 = JCM 15457]|nr:hypothetical protein JCM15457_2260 [Liquorilactobacillus sucicola DSM 21376 = JCM 15457]
MHVRKTNNAFVGIKLKPGKHQIKLTYQTPGLKMGQHFSLVGIMLLAISILVIKIRKKRA